MVLTSNETTVEVTITNSNTTFQCFFMPPPLVILMADLVLLF
jgi:hypothetical protein